LNLIAEIDRLIAPISPENPAGCDARVDPTSNALYRAIRAARSAARSSERRLSTAERDSEVPRADWKPVLDQAVVLLGERTKDLEIACYLTEALVRLHGFAGLRLGFHVCRRYVELYWENLYPRPDEDGLATRVAPLMVLNGEGNEGTLIVPLLNVPLTDSSSVGRFACSHHDQAHALERVADPKTKARRVDQGSVGLSAFQQAVADTPTAFFVELEDDLLGSLDEFGRLTERLDARCGAAAPHSSKIKNVLNHCHEVITAIAGDRIRQARAKSVEGKPAEAIPLVEVPALVEPPAVDRADHLVPHAEPGRMISSRDHALILLESISEFFRQTEPHSPIAYSLNQTVRWGRMALPDLLAELIPDANARKHYCGMIGIGPTSREP
jgi:type VI secretion system protein ImpA